MILIVCNATDRVEKLATDSLSRLRGELGTADVWKVGAGIIRVAAVKSWGTPAPAGRGRSARRQRGWQDGSGLAVYVGHQLRRRHAERGREPDDVDQTRI